MRALLCGAFHNKTNPQNYTEENKLRITIPANEQVIAGYRWPTEMNLTKEQVNRIVADRTSHFSSWNNESIKSFISVWEDRLRMAVEYHKDKRLISLAKEILEFVTTRDPSNIRMYVGRPKEGSFGFLYDKKSHEYLQMAGYD